VEELLNTNKNNIMKKRSHLGEVINGRGRVKEGS
jgi:hypothetical protein